LSADPGCPNRTVARRFVVDKGTIRQIRLKLEATGRIRPIVSRPGRPGRTGKWPVADETPAAGITAADLRNALRDRLAARLAAPETDETSDGVSDEDLLDPRIEDYAPTETGDGPGTDVNERLGDIWVTVKLEWQALDPPKRPKTGVRQWEKVWMAREVRFSVSREALKPQGGRDLLVRGIAQNVNTDLFRQGWPQGKSADSGRP
jgi:hypothetical protein